MAYELKIIVDNAFELQKHISDLLIFVSKDAAPARAPTKASEKPSAPAAAAPAAAPAAAQVPADQAEDEITERSLRELTMKAMKATSAGAVQKALKESCGVNNPSALAPEQYGAAYAAISKLVK